MAFQSTEVQSVWAGRRWSTVVPKPAKVSAIKNLGTPFNEQKLQSLLGLPKFVNSSPLF